MPCVCFLACADWVSEHEFQMFLQGSESKTGTSVAEKPPPFVPLGTPTEEATRRLMRALQSTSESSKEIFSHFDLNNDGRISPAELRRALLAMGYNVDLPTCIAFVRTFDVNNDGHLEYYELVRALSSQPRIEVRPSSRSSRRASTAPTSSRRSSRSTPAGISRSTAPPSYESTEQQRAELVRAPPRSLVSPSAVSKQRPPSAGPVGMRTYNAANYGASPSPIRQGRMSWSAGAEPPPTAQMPEPQPNQPRSAAPTQRLLSDICDAVYSTRLGPAKLYKG